MSEPVNIEQLEDEIARLGELDAPRSLGTLESDIWRGVAARCHQNRLSRLVLAVQSLVMVVALGASIAVGNRAAIATSESSELGVFSTRADLAPSTRLIGG